MPAMCTLVNGEGLCQQIAPTNPISSQLGSSHPAPADPPQRSTAMPAQAHRPAGLHAGHEVCLSGEADKRALGGLLYDCLDPGCQAAAGVIRRIAEVVVELEAAHRQTAAGGERCKGQVEWWGVCGRVNAHVCRWGWRVGGAVCKTPADLIRVGGDQAQAGWRVQANSGSTWNAASDARWEERQASAAALALGMPCPSSSRRREPRTWLGQGGRQDRLRGGTTSTQHCQTLVCRMLERVPRVPNAIMCHLIDASMLYSPKCRGVQKGESYWSASNETSELVNPCQRSQG